MSKSTADSINEHAQQIANFGRDAVLRPELLAAEIDFSGAGATLDRLQALYREVSIINFEAVPLHLQNDVLQRAGQTIAILMRFRDYKPNSGVNPPDLIHGLTEQYAHSYSILAQHLSLAIALRPQLGRQAARAAELLAMLEDSANNFGAQTADIIKKVQEALRVAEEVSNNTAAVKEAEHFESECKAHKRASWCWLFITVAIMFTIIGSVIGHLIPELRLADSIDEMVRVALPRVVILTIAYFALVWAARNYAASRHNFIVNRHRSNALSTFRAFYQGSSDLAIKNAVLMQATACVFSAQTTGYLKEEAVAQEHNKIAELISAVRGKS
jgi:hypothetical protein